MKKKYSIVLTLLVLLAIACGKYHDLEDQDPTNNPSYLYGRLVLNDTQTQNAINAPLGGKTVTVSFSDSKDEVNYLYSTTTDADGYFKFVNLNKNKFYVVSYKETIAGKVFSGKSAVQFLPSDTCKITAGIAMAGQTGFIATVRDANGNAVTGATVCLSASDIGYNSNLCDGSNYTGTTDVNGHSAQFGLGKITYYILAKATINGVQYQDKSPVTITENKVTEKTFTLNVPPAPATNGINVILLDANGSPLNNAKLCLFSSRVLFKRDTCEGSNYSTASNTAGKATITGINPDKYYILGEVALTKFKLLGRDSIVITNKVENVTLRLKP